MKKQLSKLFSLVALPLFLTSGALVAQSVAITGPSTVETGVPNSYTATVSGLPLGSTIVRYTWTATVDLAGPSGIAGTINNVPSNTVNVVSNQPSNTVPVLWGDFFPFTNQTVSVCVTYRDADNVPYDICSSTYSVTVRRIRDFDVLGPISVQSCCTDEVTYEAVGYNDGVNLIGYTFSWIWPSGWTVVGSSAGSAITLKPNTTGGGDVRCTIRRTGANPLYSRTDVISVSRTQPVTPAIPSPDFFCIGGNYEICLPEICGMSGVNWTVPPSLLITDGQGTKCIKVTPNPNAIAGTTGTITAQATMAGGCTATIRQRNFSIYFPETPPVPQGYITLDLEEGSDPCNDPVYIVNWHTNSPYLNGVTRVSPGVILGKRMEPILISVCNLNLCTGLKSCVYFWIDPPYPCGEIDDRSSSQDGPGQPQNDHTDASTLSDHIVISPNPAAGDFSVLLPAELSGAIEMFDHAGRSVLNKIFESVRRLTIHPDQPLPQGIYFLRIIIDGKIITRKVAIH